MSWELLRSHNKDIDSAGIPFNETFTKQEGRRLRFIKYLFTIRRCELTTPQTPLPKKPMPEFLGRYLRRGTP